jgi:hypothetical protein
MKKSILLTISLIISYCAIGQFGLRQNKLKSIGIKDSTVFTIDLGSPVSKITFTPPNDNFDKLIFYNRNNRPKELLRLNSKGDTLEISIPSVKFIKIDGFIYEIKRYSNISIEKVKPNWTTVLTDLAKKVDTINAKKQN